MRPLLVLHAALSLCTVTNIAAAALPPSRACSPGTRTTVVQQSDDTFRLESPRGVMTARRATERPDAAGRVGAIVTIQARAFHFDVDNDIVGTERDTVIVPPGTTIRFQLAGGLSHTVTNGFDSGAPNAGEIFSVFMDGSSPIFDTTLTTPTEFDYFCFFHEPSMGGTIIVRQNADVTPGTIAGRASFSRMPSPNPARGAVDFSIALPRAATARLDVIDLSGRHLRTLHSGSLSSGEHAFRWDGRSNRGGSVASGRYQIRLTADGVSETRAVTVLR